MRCGTRRGHLIDPQRGALLQALQLVKLQCFYGGFLFKSVCVECLFFKCVFYLSVCNVNNNSQMIELVEDGNGLVWAVHPCLSVHTHTGAVHHGWKWNNDFPGSL